MTVTDLRCDVCGTPVLTPAAGGAGGDGSGVRFVYHPGDPALRDDSGLMCAACWAQTVAGFGGSTPATSRHCAACGVPVDRLSSLHVRRYDVLGTWQLCTEHAVAFLNRLNTVHPKLRVEDFRWPVPPG